MRERLQPYRGANALNYLCLLATELLGSNHLRDLPALMTGFDSVMRTLPANVVTAIQNLRIAGHAPWSQRELRLMVDQYNETHRRLEQRRRSMTRPKAWDDDPEPTDSSGAYVSSSPPSGGDEEEVSSKRFEVDAQLNVRPVWTSIMPDDVRDALASLTSPLSLRRRPPRRRHDPTLPARVVDERHNFETAIEPLGFTPPEPPILDIARHGRAPGLVRWSDLVAVADRFDRIDELAGRQQRGERSWYRRLHTASGERTAVLSEATVDGLAECDVMELSGVKHLIGLPGAGKTTLLYLLAAWASERDYQVCFLFPSIEVATGFVERLALYEVRSALLFGQSDRARSKHVASFAAALSQDNRGYAATRSAAPFFATNCSLAAFAGDEETAFPHAHPPCQLIHQSPAGAKAGKGPVAHQCALASVCGRQEAERSLVNANVWAGHILSTDREVSPLFSDVQLRHFEYLARTFDLVVVDECDGAQANMDGRGTPLMKLSGDADSVWNRLLLDLHAPAAQGRNAFIGGASIATIMAMSGRFGQAAERLTAAIVKSPKEFRDEYARKLLTGLSLIADMFPLSRGGSGFEDDEEAQAHLDARQALERVWDFAAKRVAFREGGEALRHLNQLQREDEGGAEADQEASTAYGLGDSEVLKLAELARVTPDVVREYAKEVLDALDTWDREGTDEYLNALARVLLRAPGLAPAKEPKFFVEHVRLLANVTLLVLQHFGLSPHLRLLNGQGILGDEVFESRPSKELLGLVPESLAGRLSGVRYTVGDEGDVDIAHVGFVGTPRMLMHRLAQLGLDTGGTGPAVLLTSATSLLHDSPSYHINVGPHYVLRRPNAGAGWAESRYHFLPLKDPHDDRQRLFFSGSRLARREFVLKAMATELLDGGRASKVEAAIAQNDIVGGFGRKAAFVVNSYEQCELLYEHIRQQFPAWRERVRYLVRGGALAAASKHGITASEVERLGDNADWELFIFPMSAIGRGVNIVYKFGPRADKAMIGSLYFLTRPHPRSDSLGFLQGVVGAASEDFDQASYGSPEAALAAMRAKRADVSHKVGALLRLPQASRALGEFARPFVADQMIMILQTIGRAMRGDCPAFVYFVDAAWAPKSAVGLPDTPRTSMLLMMRRILDDCLNHPDAALRDCYDNLYRSFCEPLSNISGLHIEGT
ncbi:ATP-binding protein [Ideonella sp. 4Y16]|uniref:ATP-binding protein n=1 Tax=Ideonella alba TaxID=2824118 RepID=UPI001B3904F5|nr:ATP-binding protein [Ideonella alba]MBQ0942289.1 ATP-binding protein [Ideonella alba]